MCLTLKMIRKSLFFLIGIILTTYSLTLSALPSDNQQNISIVANSWFFNYKTGLRIYEGAVKMDQGSSHLTADRVVTKNNDKHKLEEAIAYGIQQLAEYSTIAKEGDDIFHAKAKIIKFYPLKQTIILEGDVKVTQGKNSFE